MRRRGLALLGLLVAVGACGPGPSDDGGQSVITVLAASSLQDAFSAIGEAFAAGRPGAEVRFSFGPSSGLARQIVEGARGDVFASADQHTMDLVVTGGAAAGPPRIFAANAMEIAVPAGNPAAVSGVADLARPELLIGLCAEEVPCGRVARRLLASVTVAPSIDTHEPDVRSLLTKIEAAELDAGLVYHSDVVAAGDRVDAIAVPGADRVSTDYPIVALADAGAPEVARAFVDFVLSDAGQAVLAGHGFLEPPSPPAPLRDDG